jgi:hypothetical protein
MRNTNWQKCDGSFGRLCFSCSIEVCGTILFIDTIWWGEVDLLSTCVPLDLTDHPHRYLMDPDEVMLASNLRLDCATYLTSKRRIFIKRIGSPRIGKEFYKTDAQQACKIDVNKASKLWQAFEKVGWLNNPSRAAQYSLRALS